MLKSMTLFAYCLVLFIFSGTLLLVTNPLSKHKRLDEILSQIITMPQKQKMHPTKQMRSGVFKDLWIHDKDMGRLHHHIESPRSILIAYSTDKHIQLIEQMIGMKCYLQEKIEQKNGKMVQEIRYIESKEGTYRYSDQHFEAQSVFLAFFQIPGETLCTKLNLQEAFMEGVAKEICLSFSNKRSNFHAEKFKAHIRSQGTSL